MTCDEMVYDTGRDDTLVERQKAAEKRRAEATRAEAFYSTTDVKVTEAAVRVVKADAAVEKAVDRMTAEHRGRLSRSRFSLILEAKAGRPVVVRRGVPVEADPPWVEKSRARSWSVLTPDGATTAFSSLKKALAAMVPGAVCMGYEEGTLVSTCDAWPA